MPAWSRYLAAFALAFAHAGMWAMQVLSRPVCARCRTIVVLAVPAAAALALAGAFLLARLWLRRARGA